VAQGSQPVAKVRAPGQEHVHVLLVEAIGLRQQDLRDPTSSPSIRKGSVTSEP
jgi:hypothetical protein